MIIENFHIRNLKTILLEVTTFSSVINTHNMPKEDLTTKAQFNNPSVSPFDFEGRVYVTDTVNNRIWKITRDGGGSSSSSSI